MIIDGITISGKNTFDIFNPFNGDRIGSVADASDDNIYDALQKSYDFQCELSAIERSDILLKTAGYLKEHKYELAKLITSESGLCLKDTVYEVDRVISCARYSAKVCAIVEKDTTKDFILDEMNKKPTLKVVTESLDLVIAITPFNHPMNQVAHKIFPAIASGTSVVLKPSGKTPLSAIKLVEILIKNNLPPNMINVITSSNADKFLNTSLSFTGVDMLTFTGGLHAGLKIKETMFKHGHALKRYVSELGGCSSLIICSDANLDMATDIVINGCFKNSGQRCTAIRRVVVDQNIADRFVEKLLEGVKSITFGNPFNNVDMGTVIDVDSAKKIEERINSAIASGAKLLHGGKRIGALLSPTVLDNVDLSMDIVALETFGPVCSIIRVDNFEKSLEIAKQTNYKLAGAIVTPDKEKSTRASLELKVGQFNINGIPGYRTEAAPFGGFGDSGNGEKEGVVLAAHGMRRIRTIYEHEQTWHS
jgi:aldehyde dehydrogenase (NAD+)